MPGNQEYTAALGFLEQDNVAGARALLDKAIKLNPRHAKAFYVRGTISDREQQWSSAISDYSAAIEITEALLGGREAYRTALAAEEAAEMYCRRGDDWITTGDLAWAIHDFSNALGHKAGYVRALCGRSTAFVKTGFRDLALADLNEALKQEPSQDPYHAKALCQRARIHLATGNPYQAMRDGQEAIRSNPKDAQGYWVLGAAYAGQPQPQFSQAINCYETAWQKDRQLPPAVSSELAEVYFRYGVSLEGEGKTREAEEAYRRAQTLDATRVAALREQQRQQGAAVVPVAGIVDPGALVSKARALLGKGEFDAAVDNFTEALRLNPRSAEGYFGRGRAFLAKGFPDTAAEDFAQVICLKRDAAPPQAYCQLAQAHLLLKKPYLALEEATEAIRRKPNYALAYYYRGLTYLEDRNDRRAAADFAEAAALAAHAVSPPAGMYEVPTLDPDVLTEAKKRLSEGTRGPGRATTLLRESPH
jgi:tetratricopeptide (TPR) repeat protein